MQVYNAYKYGYWYARSAEFIHSPIMEGLVWARVPGDIVFGVGVLALVMFTVTLYVKRNKKATASSASALDSG